MFRTFSKKNVLEIDEAWLKEQVEYSIESPR